MRLTLQTIVEKRQRRARGRAATPLLPLALDAAAVAEAEEVPAGCPTPAEIRERCSEIQATWTDAERRKRESWSTRPWTVPGADRHTSSEGLCTFEVQDALKRCRRSMKSPERLLDEGIRKMCSALRRAFNIWQY